MATLAQRHCLAVLLIPYKDDFLQRKLSTTFSSYLEKKELNSIKMAALPEPSDRYNIGTERVTYYQGARERTGVKVASMGTTRVKFF